MPNLKFVPDGLPARRWDDVWQPAPSHLPALTIVAKGQITLPTFATDHDFTDGAPVTYDYDETNWDPQSPIACDGYDIVDATQKFGRNHVVASGNLAWVVAGLMPGLRYRLTQKFQSISPFDPSFPSATAGLAPFGFDWNVPLGPAGGNALDGGGDPITPVITNLDPVVIEFTATMLETQVVGGTWVDANADGLATPDEVTPATPIPVAAGGQTLVTSEDVNLGPFVELI